MPPRFPELIARCDGRGGDDAARQQCEDSTAVGELEITDKLNRWIPTLISVIA